MKLNPIVKIITVLSAAALLTGTVGVSASAVVIDEEETVAAPAETVSSGDLPSYYSSLDECYVTRAKSQNYNDCWAYACLSVLESKLLKTGIATDASSVDFSELHMNLWAITRSDGTGWIRGKEDAGYCTIAPGYLSSWQGAVLESDAGDLSPDNKISGDQVSTDRAKYGVTGIRYVSRDNMDEVKRAIMDNGSVTAGYAKNNTYLNNGISYYMPPSYSGTNYGHVVAVVGWDDNYDKSNFRNTPNNNGAWLMKSSWGENNSLKGFYWVSYEDKFFLEPSKYKPSYAIESIEEITDSKKLIQNEIFGATYKYTDYSGELTALNRLNFDDDFYLLDKVIFETKVAGADYELYLVPEANGKPSADVSGWKLLGSGTTGYSGYTCADIENVELTDSTASIAVKLNKNGSDINIGVDEWVINSNNEYVFLPSPKYGMSYIYKDGAMTDLLQWYKTSLNDDIGGTFVIKALTVKPDSGDVNLDSKININDVTLIQEYNVELEALSDRQQKLADYNGDGIIDITDATAIQLYIAS